MVCLSKPFSIYFMNIGFNKKQILVVFAIALIAVAAAPRVFDFLKGLKKHVPKVS